MSAMTSGLFAALRLARGQADGVLLVPGDRASATRSFWAIPLCLPSIVFRLLMYWASAGVPKHAGLVATREVITFLLGWLVFVEVTVWLAPFLGRAERWGRFIALWNWCNVIEGVLIVLGGIPGLLGAPSIVDQTCQLVMIGWALWLEWYATRLGFGISALAAAWLVVLDQVIGVMLTSLVPLLGP